MGIQAFKSVARQRARLVGRLIKLEQRIMTDSATIPELRAKIHSYDDVLRSQGIDVDPDIYAPPVTPTPKRMYFAYGEMTALCLAALRTAGRLLTTVELLNGLVCAKRAYGGVPRTETTRDEASKTQWAFKPNGASSCVWVLLAPRMMT